MKLSRYEQESILNYNAGEQTAILYTTYIARAKQKSGESTRLETFDFLGFTFSLWTLTQRCTIYNAKDKF